MHKKEERFRKAGAALLVVGFLVITMVIFFRDVEFTVTGYNVLEQSFRSLDGYELEGMGIEDRLKNDLRSIDVMDSSKDLLDAKKTGYYYNLPKSYVAGYMLVIVFMILMMVYIVRSK